MSMNSVLFCQFGSLFRKPLETVLNPVNQALQDPDLFQKISLIAMSAIQGLGLYRGALCLPKLAWLLDLANINDFYNVLQHPYSLLYRVKPERVDEYKLLKSVSAMLSLKRGSLLKEADTVELQGYLSQFLQDSVDSNEGYRDNEEFRAVLLEFLSAKFPGDQIGAELFEVSFRPYSVCELFSGASLALFDIGCVPHFLNQWGVISLGKVASSIGVYRGFRWLPSHSLEQFITVAYSLSFAFQFLGAFNVVCDDISSKKQKEGAWWDLLVSTGEISLNLAILKNGGPLSMVVLTGVAKSLGVFSAFYKPRVDFFQRTWSVRVSPIAQSFEAVRGALARKIDSIRSLKDVHARRLSSLYTMEGLEKMVCLTAPILKLFTAFGCEGVGDWLNQTKGQRDLYQASFIVPSLLAFSAEPSKGQFLALMKSVADTCQFLVKYGVHRFTLWEATAQKMGQLCFFRNALASHLLNVPRDFFTLSSSAWEIKEVANRYYIQAGSTQKTASERRREMLHLAYHLGQIALVIVRGVVKKELIANGGARHIAYCMLEIGTYSTGLANLFIK
jgi:hypothetical protein